MSSLPKLAQLEFGIEEITVAPHMGKSYLFDFDTGRLVIRNGNLVKIQGLDVLLQWVNMTLRTEKKRYKVYKDTDYGVQLENLIGSNFKQSFIDAEIKREVLESLLQNPFIIGIKDWVFDRKGAKMNVWFTIITRLGQSEVTFDV